MPVYGLFICSSAAPDGEARREPAHVPHLAARLDHVDQTLGPDIHRAHVELESAGAPLSAAVVRSALQNPQGVYTDTPSLAPRPPRRGPPPRRRVRRRAAHTANLAVGGDHRPQLSQERPPRQYAALLRRLPPTSVVPWRWPTTPGLRIGYPAPRTETPLSAAVVRSALQNPQGVYPPFFPCSIDLNTTIEPSGPDAGGRFSRWWSPRRFRCRLWTPDPPDTSSRSRRPCIFSQSGT